MNKLVSNIQNNCKLHMNKLENFTIDKFQKLLKLKITEFIETNEKYLQFVGLITNILLSSIENGDTYVIIDFPDNNQYLNFFDLFRRDPRFENFILLWKKGSVNQDSYFKVFIYYNIQDILTDTSELCVKLVEKYEKYLTTEYINILNEIIEKFQTVISKNPTFNHISIKRCYTIDVHENISRLLKNDPILSGYKISDICKVETPRKFNGYNSNNNEIIFHLYTSTYDINWS